MSNTRFHNSIPVHPPWQDDQRPAPVPLFQSETAEKILKHVWIPLGVIIGSIPIAAGATWYFHDWDMLNIVPIGLMLAGAMLFVLTFREFLEHIDLHPARSFLDMLDGRRDGKLFGVPIADEFTDEAKSEIDLERRIRRAIKAVTSLNVSPTRDSICGEQKLMSQREWYFWHIRMIRAGIFNDQHQVLVPSEKAAHDAWDRLTQSKSDGRHRQLNIGEGKKSVLAIASDLLNKVYVQ